MTVKKNTKKDFIKNKVMLAYGVLQLCSKVVSAVALVAIALGFCSLKKESNFFNECVEKWKLLVRHQLTIFPTEYIAHSNYPQTIPS